jgi:tRNA nucleotidyltransferase/poly(A) polymerase
MNKEDIASKNIQFGGYFIRILSEDKKRYMLLCLRTEIYNNILSVLPKHDNQYKSFLELYQCDKLTEVLPYLHKYPADVIRRINMSVRILSKEILNIYHLTRKKQNCELYESLSFSYRKVLYDLHQIYVNQKNIDFHVKSHDILKEKKSISVDIVYMYLKELKNSDLIKIFEERNKLINELKKINFHYEEILSVTNIDIITQTELMFS